MAQSNDPTEDPTSAPDTTPTPLLPSPAPTIQVPESPETPSPKQSSHRKRTAPPTRDELSDKQELKITGRLLDPIRITFTGLPEKLRAFSNKPPLQLYRTFHEESKTLSAYMNTENQPKHREAEGIKILLSNAFQAIGAPNLAIDLTLNRLDRHLSWQTVVGPSSWISAFNRLHWAIRRAKFHTNESTKIGHRISIAGISTKGLVSATIHAAYEITYEITTSHGRGRPKEVTETYVEIHPVAIPVWIRKCAVPADGSPITPQQLEASGADLWVSVTELRHSDLKLISRNSGFYEEILKKGHDYEWLCLGSIAKAHITCVMPWDGKALFSRENNGLVFSRSSPEKYIFDWKVKQWRLDPKLYAFAIFQDRKARLAREAARQKRTALRLEKSRKMLKSSGGEPAKFSRQQKLKRKPTLDEDGYDLIARPSKIVRTNADVWNLMIAAQKNSCHCNEERRTRAGSAHL